MSAQSAFDLAALRRKSSKLQKLLNSHSGSRVDARTCLQTLRPIFQSVAEGRITEPLKSGLTCGYYFHEGSLRAIPGLEQAYAEFSIALQGWDDASIRDLLKS